MIRNNNNHGKNHSYNPENTREQQKAHFCRTKVSSTANEIVSLDNTLRSMPAVTQCKYTIHISIMKIDNGEPQ